MGSSSVPDESEQYVDDARFRIPFDLFVSKKQKNGILGSGSCIRFNDSCGNLVFKVERPPPPNSRDQKSAATFHQNPPIKLIFNASGNTLFCIRKLTDGSWQGFRVTDSREELMFRVQKTVDKLTRTEFEIFLIGEESEDSKTDFKMRGSPFKRSCTIYKGNSIMAETSLMYKMGIQKAFVPRSRFRVTIFPGHIDLALVVSLVVIFFDGRKLWI
ncbi:protein LURP-one-related 7 [Coffea eugenioides]|uniref:Protein LURP-one-related 7-like isoform X1 n=1 Tax=Coffea arabica TaxID=13443 RepID=A0A6P6UML9_COFAR|nr:protein LURP-one-related 7-like [Coffea arabica]XP_027177787.1 protein LURP-one-related 7 [Coffea eugenioides]